MDRGLVGSRQEGNRVTQREKPKGILGAQLGVARAEGRVSVCSQRE